MTLLYISIFSRKATGFHGRKKLSDLNFVVKPFLLMVKPGRKIRSHNPALLPAFTETPDKHREFLN